MSAEKCSDCPVATASRRAFLRDVGLAAAAALAVTALPAAALAESVVETAPIRLLGRRRVYPIPRGDSISVDTANDVIIARWQNRVFAFSLKCPHRGTRLEWRANEERLFCPKHKARFRPDGAHDSGRATRDLDRHPIARDGAALSVDLDLVLRADTDATAWGGAVVTVG